MAWERTGWVDAIWGGLAVRGKVLISLSLLDIWCKSTVRHFSLSKSSTAWLGMKGLDRTAVIFICVKGWSSKASSYWKWKQGTNHIQIWGLVEFFHFFTLVWLKQSRSLCLVSIPTWWSGVDWRWGIALQTYTTLVLLYNENRTYQDSKKATSKCRGLTEKIQFSWLLVEVHKKGWQRQKNSTQKKWK